MGPVTSPSTPRTSCLCVTAAIIECWCWNDMVSALSFCFFSSFLYAVFSTNCCWLIKKKGKEEEEEEEEDEEDEEEEEEEEEEETNCVCIYTYTHMCVCVHICVYARVLGCVC